MIPIQQIIDGAIKNAGRQRKREQGSYANEKSYQQAQSAATSTGTPIEILIDIEETQIQMNNVTKMIERFTKNPKHRQLLVRRFLKGENIRSLAEDLGMSYAGARTTICRARKFFGLSEDSD